MSEYVDFVLCKHEGCDKPYLFHAPAFSHLEKGDLVTVETSKGEQMVMVIASMSVQKNDMDAIDFIMNATRADSDVKKVLKKV